MPRRQRLSFSVPPHHSQSRQLHRCGLFRCHTPVFRGRARALKHLPKVATEMALSELAYNLTRVMNIVGVKPLITAIGA
jgi:hypothetical protein